jgi:hypothetical protein
MRGVPLTRPDSLLFKGEEMKICFRCKISKELSEFHKNKNQADGVSNQCKDCARGKRKEHYWSDPKASIASVLAAREKNSKKILEYNKKYAKANPDKVRQWRAKTAIEKKLLYSARQRSKKRNTPFSICEKDIVVPEFCPVLGIKIERSKTGHSCDNSPSLDCVIPQLGYVPGNIMVISHKANTIKSNATVEDLEKVLQWLRAHVSSGT